MVAFVFSCIVLIVAVVIPMRYAKRRPVGTPLTWGEAMVAALYVFFVMFLAWGIMPHQWLTYADNALQWRKDKVGIPHSYEGTSMAVPHVSATAALVIASGILGADPSPAAVEHRLEATARDLGTPGYDKDYGWGLINAAAATDPAVPVT